MTIQSQSPNPRCNCCGLPVNPETEPQAFQRDMVFLICDMCAKLSDEQLDKLPLFPSRKHDKEQ